MIKLKKQFLQSLGVAECFEFRLDHLQNLTFDEVQTLCKDCCDTPFIFTLRMKHQGGEFQGSFKDRSKALHPFFKA